VVGNSLVSMFNDRIIDIDWGILVGVGTNEEYALQLRKSLNLITEKQKLFFLSKNKKDLQLEIRNLKL